VVRPDAALTGAPPSPYGPVPSGAGFFVGVCSAEDGTREPHSGGRCPLEGRVHPLTFLPRLRASSSATGANVNPVAGSGTTVAVNDWELSS
jgi:hypothetical protein